MMWKAPSTIMTTPAKMTQPTQPEGRAAARVPR